EHGGGAGAAACQPGAARVEAGCGEDDAAERADARLPGGQPAADQPGGDDGGGLHGLGGLDRGAHATSLRRAPRRGWDISTRCLDRQIVAVCLATVRMDATVSPGRRPIVALREGAAFARVVRRMCTTP